MDEHKKRSHRVVISGGTSGIGLATARNLLRDGHRVFVCGRSEDKLLHALSDLDADAGIDNISGCACDVRNMDDVFAMITSATKFLGGIDGLVNNAGVAAIQPFESLTPETWKDMIDTNLTGVFNCCHAALPELKKSDQANIINLGSRAGRYAFAGGTAYNTTKFGLQGFSEALFLDLNQYGISVSLIAPGTVATRLADVEEQSWNLQPEDVASVIADVLRHQKRVNLNWIEMRSSIPR